MDQMVDGQSFVLNDPTATKQMMETIEEGGDPSNIVGVSGLGPRGYTSGSGSSGYSSASSTGTGSSGYYDEESYDDYDPSY